MNALNSYNGFFNNIGADLIAALLDEDIQYILSVKSSTLSNYADVTSPIVGYAGLNSLSSEMLKMYLYIDETTHKMRLKNCYGIEITMYLNKDNIKSIPDLFYFDQQDSIKLTLILHDMSQSDLNMLTERLPGALNLLRIDNCNISSWDWLKGVKYINDISISKSSLPNGISSKTFTPECIDISLNSITFGGNRITGLPNFTKNHLHEIRIMNCFGVSEIDAFDGSLRDITALSICNTNDSPKFNPQQNIMSFGDMSKIDYISGLFVTYDIFSVFSTTPKDKLPKKIRYIEISNYPNTPEAEEMVNKIKGIYGKIKIKTKKF